MKLPPVVNHPVGDTLLSVPNKVNVFDKLFYSCLSSGRNSFRIIDQPLLVKNRHSSAGSGNIGMTNVMRVGGKLPGLLTFVLDFGKGSVAVLIAKTFIPTMVIDLETQKIFLSLAGVIVVCGHVFLFFCVS